MSAQDFAHWSRELYDPLTDESSVARPGEAIVYLIDDVPVVFRADRYILVSDELWREIGGGQVIELDPVAQGGAGLHRYRYIGDRARGARLFARCENTPVAGTQ